MPYRQAAKVLAEFLPIEPTESYATVRKRTIRTGERFDDQTRQETWRARSQADDRRQLEMQLSGDRRKEFVSASIPLMFAAPSATRRETSNPLWPDAAAGEPGGRTSSPAAPVSMQSAIARFLPLGKSDIAALAM
ncbi:MAG: hypothetical protein ABIL01_22190 [Pseudomonadota bacterium]